MPTNRWIQKRHEKLNRLFEPWIAWPLAVVRVLSIGVAVWMALGPVPGWIELPALAVLWTVGLLIFAVEGLPFLLLPFHLVWRALRPVPSPEAEREARAFDAVAEEARESVMARRPFVLEGEGGERFEVNTRGINILPYWLETLLQIIGGIALLVVGRPVLAFLYLFPVLAIFLFEAVLRARAALSRSGA